MGYGFSWFDSLDNESFSLCHAETDFYIIHYGIIRNEFGGWCTG